jgi:hypothetical protein
MTSLAGIVIRASGLDLMAVTPYDRAHWGRAVLADPGKRIVVSETFLFETDLNRSTPCFGCHQTLIHATLLPKP